MTQLRYLIFISVISIIFIISGCTKNDSNSFNLKNCNNEQFNEYADSLSKLILQDKPFKIIAIADSIINKYPETECSGLIRIKAERASAYEYISDYQTAININRELIHIAHKNNFFKEEVGIRLSLARIFETNSFPDLSQEQLDEARALIDKYNYEDDLSRWYIRQASYLRIFEKDYDKAEKYARKAIELGEKHNVFRSILDGNLLLGLVIQNLEESISYYQKVVSMYRELGDITTAMYIEYNMAIRYFRNGNLEIPLKFIEKVDSLDYSTIGNEKRFYQFLVEVSSFKANVYRKLGDKDKLIEALEDLNKYTILANEFIYQERYNKLLLENKLNQETEQKEIIQRANRGLRIGLAILSCVFLILLRVYYLNIAKSRKIQKQTLTISKQYAELENIYNFQSTLLNEVHHRIKNNLQLIISLITIQNAKISEPKFSEVLEMLNHRIRSISLIHEQLYTSKEFHKINVQTYITNLLNNFRSLTTDKEIKFQLDVDDIYFNLETITPLGLIVSELTSNSLKANKSLESILITITLKGQGEQYLLHFSDNGAGYPDGKFNSNSKGMGYSIITGLARQIYAELDTYNLNGAHFTMKFKEKVTSQI